MFLNEILESHGIGLVRFLRSLDARVALSSRNGWIVPENGRPLQVRLGKEASTPEPNPNAFPTSVISPNSETYEMPINLFGGLYSPPRRFAEQNPAVIFSSQARAKKYRMLRKIDTSLKINIK